MKKASKLLAAIALSTLPAFATAEPYVGLNYAWVELDDFDLGALAFKGGYKFNDWAALEGRIATGVKDDGYYWATVELDHMMGGYFVAGIPNSTPFYPYAVAGFSTVEAKASGGGASESADESGVSYGAGIDFAFTETVSGNAEFMRYLDEDGGEVDALSLGVSFKF